WRGPRRALRRAALGGEGRGAAAGDRLAAVSTRGRRRRGRADGGLAARAGPGAAEPPGPRAPRPRRAGAPPRGRRGRDRALAVLRDLLLRGGRGAGGGAARGGLPDRRDPRAGGA